MNSVVLPLSEARKIILHAAGLAKKAPFGKGREAVYKAIVHLGYVQIDTNYTVERAHHHTLYSRIPDYDPAWIEDLQEDGRIFEYFTSDTGYIPMQNYRFSLPVKESIRKNRKPLTAAEISMMQKVLDRIGREGPLMVSDFENDRTEASSGWWDWRPSKVALERLYMDGRLMITRKKDFRKVFDLPMNVLPGDAETGIPDDSEYARYVIRHILRSLGIASAKEMQWRARFTKNHRIKQELEKMAEAGEICRVTVEGRKTPPLFMLKQYRNKKIALSDEAWILSPFDPLNVFRFRLRDFFDFDYQIECFVPEAKRKFGYFSLPLLLGDRFVARADSKADRKNNVLLIHNLHFEPGKLSPDELKKIAAALAGFMAFNKCRTVQFFKTNNKAYQKAIRSALPE